MWLDVMDNYFFRTYVIISMTIDNFFPQVLIIVMLIFYFKISLIHIFVLFF